MQIGHHPTKEIVFSLNNQNSTQKQFQSYCGNGFSSNMTKVVVNILCLPININFKLNFITRQ